MKKTVLSLLIVSILLSLCSCVASREEQDHHDYDHAKEAYRILVKAEAVCIEGMEDMYNAWYFGLYEAGTCTAKSVFDKLSQATSFSSAELSEHGGYSWHDLVYGVKDTDGWQYCLWTVENCFEARGDYERLDALLAESKAYIQSISEDYEYYGALKDYYGKVAPYAEFFKNTTGSFDQLQDTVKEHENGIRKAKEAFMLDFE